MKIISIIRCIPKQAEESGISSDCLGVKGLSEELPVKDLPHHMRKLNRSVVRSERHLNQEDPEHADKIPSPPQQSPRPKSQVRKQAKEHMRQEREAHTPIKKTVEERDHELKKRVPLHIAKGQKKPRI